jgi:hypothetical protein
MNWCRKLVAQISNLPYRGFATCFRGAADSRSAIQQIGNLRYEPRCDAPLAPRRSRCSQTAFSLLEVMIACGIFFMAVFAILAMVAAVLRNARSLRRTELDAGMVAAQVTKTNRLTEGIESGDFGNLYQDYSWETEAYEAQTNGLWQVDIVVRRRGVQQPVDSMSILVYSPDSSTRVGPR